MNGKVTDEAVVAALIAIASGHVSKNQVRAGLEAALPHLQPAKPEAVRLRDELRERAGFDVTRHQLVTKRLASINDLERAQNADQYKASMRKQIGDDVGDAIVSRYPETWTPESRSPKVTLRHEVFVFSPEELAALIAATGKQQVGEVQGDTLSLAECITDHLCQHEYDIGGRAELLACVTEALAARQSAGQVVGYVSRDSSKAHMCVNLPEGSPIYAIAARQPVGQEPYGWHLVASGNGFGHQEHFTRSPVMTELVKAAMVGRVEITPLFDHPPAQAVDLGQLRKRIEALRVYSGGYYLRRDAVLALIDSRQTG